ncbi:MAG: hypothetical protein HOV81_10255 [Kofleriaceae bacterium]|nr:hypothetical protein [Kofleriaceae bacterium]
MARWLAIVLVSLAVASCSRASNEGEAKKWQESPPPKDVSVPAGLSIAVTVDGADQPSITSTSLSATKPDYVDTEHRAWKIATLVAAASSGATVEASSPNGVSVKFATPTPEGLEPVLFLTRRGEVIVAALDPKDPFPRYHGQGSRLKRPGDTMPRVAPVTRLSITHGAP